jgi:hypothetical protein
MSECDRMVGSDLEAPVEWSLVFYPFIYWKDLKGVLYS